MTSTVDPMLDISLELRGKVGEVGGGENTLAGCLRRYMDGFVCSKNTLIAFGLLGSPSPKSSARKSTAAVNARKRTKQSSV